MSGKPRAEAASGLNDGLGAMPKQKKPDHCRGCTYYHKAGHKKGSALCGSKYDNWCCKYSNHAPRAVSICIQMTGKDVA